jgi:YVTN family beta-propeller protein
MTPTAALLLPVAVLSLAAQTAPVRAVNDPGVITTRQTITPAGVQAIFDGRVYGVAFGARLNEIFVLHAKGVTRLDWRSNRMLSQSPLKGRMGLQGICYDFRGNRALAVHADPKGKIQLLSIADQSAEALSQNIGTTHAGAIASNGSLAIAPLISQNSVAVFDLAARRVIGTAKTGIAPFGAALNREGTVAFVTNWGGRVPRNGDLTAKAGADSGADSVVVDSRGIASTGTVTRIDLRNLAATATIAVGLHPTALVWDEPRRRLYVANTNQESVSVIDTESNRVVRTMDVQPFPRKVTGIAPTALAVSADGSTLYVACGGINAVAVISVAEGRTLGLIPTGWYPIAVSLSPDRSHLAVGTLLGPGSGNDQERKGRWAHAYRGSVSVLPIPDKGQLASYTTAVAENNHMTLAPVQRAPITAAAAVPDRSGDASLIEHVVYIIKENRTYDQVFGDIPKGNGDPALTMFGEAVTPNQHRLAEQFVLLDNFYATGGNSGDGHQWVTQANETAYCLWPGYFGRSYPFDGADPIAPAAGGFLWDAALARKRTVKIFGEYAGRMNTPSAGRMKLLEEWNNGADFTSRWNTTAPIAPLNRILARNYPAYSTAIPDVARAQIFVAELKKWTAAGSMPNLVMVQLPSNHTSGVTPGRSTPKAMVADNDYALGLMVEALTHSPFWKKMAIFVVEDDAQNGVDHVDGHRTVALAISPYIRRGSVDSTFYSHQSIVKTIELMLGLPALSLFDLIANDMRNSFHLEPDLSAYQVARPEQSLFEVNPALSGLRGAARKAAIASMKMRWDVPDAAPVEKLNRIVWGAVRGWETPYPGSRQAVFSPFGPVEADE